MAEPLRALVVDDEPDVQLLFSQRFRRETRKGLVQLSYAELGPEALKRLLKYSTYLRRRLLPDLCVAKYSPNHRFVCDFAP